VGWIASLGSVSAWANVRWNLDWDAKPFATFKAVGQFQFWTRTFPTLGPQGINALGFRLDWEPLAFLSVGPYFRGLTSFSSGTTSTSVKTTLNEAGVMVGFYPFVVGSQTSQEIDVRMALFGGGLMTFYQVTFTQTLNTASTFKSTFNTWVFPLEVHLELVLAKRVVLDFFGGYALFEQAQGIYWGAGMGILI
jgi:hypothetical protein